MRHRMTTSLVAAAVLMLGLHAATPVSQAAEGPGINATCTVYADPAYRSGSTVFSSHSIRCTGTVSMLSIFGSLSGPSYRNSSKSCYNTNQCILNLSAPYVAGTWITRSQGNADGSMPPSKTTYAYL